MKGSVGTEQGLCGLRKEPSNQSLVSKTEYDIHRLSVPQICAPQPEMGICRCTQGLDAGTWSLESITRDRLLLAMRSKPEEME